MPREPPRSPPLIRFLKRGAILAVFLGGMYLHWNRYTPERALANIEKQRPRQSEMSRRRIEMLQAQSQYRKEEADEALAQKVNPTTTTTTSK